MSTFVRAADTTATTTVMHMAMDIPMSLVVDADFGLEALLHVEAEIAAATYLGQRPAAVCFRSFDARAVATGMPDAVVHIETVWDITRAE
ncbi:hypothetical protein EKD04_009565 [Chloroflexales bacterium ZM16-3]|nr:hypothetical protein [Chloroflexales bacterium ZM16-3]